MSRARVFSGLSGAGVEADEELSHASDECFFFFLENSEPRRGVMF